MRIVRAFVTSPSARLRAGCAREVPAVRALGSFPEAVGPSAPAARVARLAALTVADLPDRWWNNYSGHGVGLRGGTWTYTGDRVVTFRLTGVRLARGLSVSGTAVWDRYGETMRVDLTLRTHGRPGHVRGSWATRRPRARAHLTGSLDGARFMASFAAP